MNLEELDKELSDIEDLYNNSIQRNQYVPEYAYKF